MSIQKRILALTSAAAAFALQASPSFAGQVFSEYLSDGTCYQRFYEPSHLRKHPRQTVSKFHVKALDGNSRRFTVDFGYWVKNEGAYSATAECTAKRDGAHCYVEADGGSFRIAPHGDGIKVTLGDRLEVEGDKDVSPDLAMGDNRVMHLPVAGKGDTCM